MLVIYELILRKKKIIIGEVEEDPEILTLAFELENI